MHQASAPVFRLGLGNLSAILDKASAHCEERKIDPAFILGDRLSPDMLPFTRQVQLSSDFAKNTMARLAGREPPRFEDTETTFHALKERVARALDAVEGVPAAEVDGSEDRLIVITVAAVERRFRGQDYLLHFALPNFFFHLTTAYAILRHDGVPLGKRDFIGPAPQV
jgi:hypothetical protein